MFPVDSLLGHVDRSNHRNKRICCNAHFGELIFTKLFHHNFDALVLTRVALDDVNTSVVRSNYPGHLPGSQY